MRVHLNKEHHRTSTTASCRAGGEIREKKRVDVQHQTSELFLNAALMVAFPPPWVELGLHRTEYNTSDNPVYRTGDSDPYRLVALVLPRLWEHSEKRPFFSNPAVC